MKKQYTFIELLEIEEARKLIDSIEYLLDCDEDDIEYRNSLIAELKNKYGYEYKI